jgi:hypothetical protein
MNKTKADVEYNTLKKKLLSIGLPIPGTIHELYARCGSETCPCATDDTKRHGPYPRWHYRKCSRQCTIGIDCQTEKLIQQGIKNREELEILFEKMLEVGARYVEDLLVKKKRTAGNSKKIRSLTRGM